MTDLPKTMRAWMLERTGPANTRPLVLSELQVPSPDDGELLIKVNACGICRTDLHVIEGDLEVRRPGVVPGHQIVGTVAALGNDAGDHKIGDRVGVAWLNETCGICRFCVTGRENLCENAEFTGWTKNGGYAEYVIAPAAFSYPVPASFEDVQAAPLLCAGIIGYRSLRLTGLLDRPASRLGIYGFGAAGHVCIQIAKAREIEVYVMTRDRELHQDLARELGAAWVGDTYDQPPVKLDAAIVFAPAGEIVPAGLKALDKAGVLVLGGIHMSPIPEFDYDLLYGERVVRSVANNTREDGHRFLEEAAAVKVRTSVQVFPFESAGDALIALKNDGIRGAGVLKI